MIIILYAIIIGIIILFFINSYNKKENFINIDSTNIRFTNLNDVLIKSFNINSVYSLYDNKLKDLFIDDIIRIHIPYNYSVSIRYSLINDPSIIAKVIELPYGSYDINKQTSNKIINQIDIKNMIYYNNYLLSTSNTFIPYYWDSDLYDSYRPEYYKLIK